MLSFWPVCVSVVALALVAGLLILLFIRAALVVVTVRSTSMSPTLLDGDRVLALRHWPARWLRKGQIVILWPWDFPPQEIKPFGVADPYIKRIVGMPGETLITSLTELNEFQRPQAQALHDDQGRRVWHIPAEHIFVRGDNPIGGVDSLSWGPVPFRSVLSRVILKLPRRETLDYQGEVRLGFQTLQPGGPAPAFTVETLKGEQITLNEYAGRSVALIFTAATGLCRQVIPYLEAERVKAASDGVEFILVSLAPVTETQAFVNELHLSWSVLVAPQASHPLAKDYDIPGVPAYCLIDAQGKVQSAGLPSLHFGEWPPMVTAWAKAREAGGRLTKGGKPIT